MTVVDRFVQAVSHGGAMARPTLIVIHSAETPLEAGYASSIATNWFGKLATTSAHFMVDPVEIIRMLSDNVVSYAVGPNANGFTLNIEQAGRASFSRDQWTTDAGRTQISKVGALVHELSDARGIPLRWASDQQIRDAAHGVPGGVCFHNDIARVLGGTTHTDPIPNYPRDLVEQAWSGAVTEEFTVAQYDDIMAAIAQVRAEAWQQHKDMANFNGTNFNNLVAILVGGMPAGQSNFHWVVDQVARMIAAIPGATVDKDALAAAVRESLSAVQPVDVKRLATDLANEADRRARDGDATTGPVS